MEDSEFDAGSHLVQGDDELVLEREVRLGANAVDQQLDRHASARGLDQMTQQQAAGLINFEDVGEDADLLGRRGTVNQRNPRLHQLTIVKTGDQVDTLRVGVLGKGKNACQNERQASRCGHDLANWFDVSRALRP